MAAFGPDEKSAVIVKNVNNTNNTNNANHTSYSSKHKEVSDKYPFHFRECNHSHAVSNRSRFGLYAKQSLRVGRVVLYDAPVFMILKTDVQFMIDAQTIKSDDTCAAKLNVLPDGFVKLDVNVFPTSDIQSYEWLALLFLFNLFENASITLVRQPIRFREICNIIFKQLHIDESVETLDLDYVSKRISTCQVLKMYIDKIANNYQVREVNLLRKQFPMYDTTNISLLSEIVRLFCGIKLRCIPIHNWWTTELIGWGLYEYVSGIHYDTPLQSNCCLLFEDNGNAYLHPFRPILENEELIINPSFYGSCIDNKCCLLPECHVNVLGSFTEIQQPNLCEVIANMRTKLDRNNSNNDIRSKSDNSTKLDTINTKSDNDNRSKVCYTYTYTYEFRLAESIFYRFGMVKELLSCLHDLKLYLKQAIQQRSSFATSATHHVFELDILRMKVFLFCLNFYDSRNELVAVLTTKSSIRRLTRVRKSTGIAKTNADKKTDSDVDSDTDSDVDEDDVFANAKHVAPRFLTSYSQLLPAYIKDEYLLFSRMIQSYKGVYPFYDDLFYNETSGFLFLKKHLSDLLHSSNPRFCADTAHPVISSRVSE